MRTLCTLIVAVALSLAPLTAMAQPTSQPSAPPTVAPTPVGPGVQSRTLGEAGGCDAEGRLFDELAIDLTPAHWLRVWVYSEDFDTVLTVTTPGGEVRESDDFISGELHSAIELRPSEIGRYTIRVRAFGPDSEGDYELGIVNLDPPAERVMRADDRVDAHLEPSGLGPLLGAWGSLWIEAEAGERLRLRVTSPDFDTVAMLVGPDGQLWSNDDANDVGPDGAESSLDSTIEAVVPTSGHYHLIVFPYGGSGSGAFTVRSQSRPPVVLEAGQERPDEGYAGSDGRGRILGLFAGITDYPGEESDLYGCADDATLLARAFRERGLMGAADQIVLTDAQVTRAGFLNAITALAGQAKPDDVVMIFYSGHGDTTAAAPGDAIELDGTDERLAVFDGEITDNEVVARIDALHADTVVLALDACNSGGFERDFVTRPGRIGIFSSDPDVLSDTAEVLNAGGYLAYYLRMAVLGHADRAPADGAMLAGELTDYLHEGFARSHDDMNPAADDSPNQMLQVDRGSVRHGDLLWLYPRQPNGELVPVPDLALRSEPPDESTPRAGGACR